MECNAASWRTYHKEEEHAVKQMHADQSEGKKEIPVLFEEMDGVWLSMQEVHHKKREEAGNEGLHHV